MKIALQPTDFPDRHLNCYEASLIGILQYMGLTDMVSLMGHPAYFVLETADLDIYPRPLFIRDAWQQQHNLHIVTHPIANETMLDTQIVTQLSQNQPLSLPVDAYYLPNTSQYTRLHELHFVNVFGADKDTYHIWVPYYRTDYWLDKTAVYTSFFSPVVQNRTVLSIPALSVRSVTYDDVLTLIKTSCAYMLGQDKPAHLAHVADGSVGLAGIQTFFARCQQLLSSQPENLWTIMLRLAAEISTVGYARYWFHQVVQRGLGDMTPLTDDDDKLLAQVTHAWLATGMRLGNSVYSQNIKLMNRTIQRLANIYTYEEQLFTRLAGLL